MRWFRFHIAGLIVFILFCGVALASLKESTELWEHAIFSLTLLVLFTAVLLAFHRTGRRRSFWLGFALVGGGYLALSLIPAVESRLISSQAFAYLHSRLPDQGPQTVLFTVNTSPQATSVQTTSTVTLTGGGNLQIAGTPTTGATRVWRLGSGTLLAGWGSSPENFVRLGHSWLALMLGWLGGRASRWLALKGERGPGVTVVALDPREPAPTVDLEQGRVGDA